MNANRYRLVRSRETGLLVPVAEHCSGRRKGASGGLSRAALALALAMFGQTGHAANTLAAGTVPSFGHTVNGSVTVNAPVTTATGRQLTVDQFSQKAITYWNNFNIANGSGVTFNSSYNGLAQHLARIGASGDPRSIIEGSLNTNGNLQLTLVNPNGFLFTSTARVDVSSLIASALDIPDATFLTGIFASLNTSNGLESGFNSATSPAARIDVEKGAVLKTLPATGGKIVLIAPAEVNNAGTIETPDGQTILAAGTRAYFVPSDPQDLRMRGWLVEVDGGGKATNLGDITAARGNITLIGKTVQQDGHLTATTSVGANGSIWLVAGDTPRALNGTHSADREVQILSMAPSQTGAITLGAGSRTEVTADETDTLGIDSNTSFNKSDIRILGGSIDSYGTVAAKGGNVSMVALDDLSGYYSSGIYKDGALDQSQSRNPANYLKVHDGSVIDVSGYTVDLPMSRNVIQVELRDQLKDSPLQRYSFLRGAKINVDVRRGTPLADISAAIAGIQRGVKEKLSDGGTVKMVAQGDTIVSPGAGINVSAGAVRYAKGLIATTKLIGANGRTYDISAASPDLIYTGFADRYTTSNAKYGTSATKTYTAPGRMEAAYVDGANAGSIIIQSNGIALAGNLQGNTTAGREQLDPAKTPLAGELQLLTPPAAQTFGLGGKTYDVLFRSGAVPTPQLADDGSLSTDQATMLSTDMLAQGGFGRITVKRAGQISLAAGEKLVLSPGGSLALTGNSVNVAGEIAVPAGTVALKTSTTDFGGTGVAGDLVVAGGAKITAAGRWVNERPGQPGVSTATRHINGGSITLDAGGNLLVGDAVNGQLKPAVFDVGGGAYVAPNGKVTVGKGGNLTATESHSDQQLRWVADIRAKALGKGGTLALTAPSVVIRNAELSANEYALSNTLILPAWRFNSLGFSQYNINAAEGDFVVEPGTAVTAAAPYLYLLPGATLAETGSDMMAFTQTGSDPYLRKPASVAFTQVSGIAIDGVVTGGVLSVGTGASITVDPTASILLSGGNVYMDGTLTAPAGNIKLELAKSEAAQDRSIWLGSHAALLANGVARYIPTANGSLSGTVYGGGSVVLDANANGTDKNTQAAQEAWGSVIAEQGSRIQAAGTAAAMDVQTDAGLKRETIGSDGGTVTVAAKAAIILDGEIKADAGLAGSRNGALSVSGPAKIEIGAGRTPHLPAGSNFADGLAGGFASVGKTGFVDAGMVAAAGVDSLTVKAVDPQDLAQIDFTSDVKLALPRNLVLDAPLFEMNGHQVELESAYLKLGSSNTNAGDPIKAAATLPGGGSLTANAGWIDLFGQSAINGASQAGFHSKGDIRFIGRDDSLSGFLYTKGNLDFSATQLYAASLHQFEVQSDGGRIDIASNGQAPTPVLSAGSQLSFSAADINQGGVIKAPLGKISLNATNKLTLLDGSLTSVSAEGQTIPLGSVANGADWHYDPLGVDYVQSQPVAKAVNLTGKEVVQKAGAQVDISGGGDLYAYEWIAGQGGSKDVLLPENNKAAFAVIPSQTSGYAPYDSFYQQGKAATPGQVIYLSGGNGLSAGYYTVLPARYALLKGAYLVTPQSGTTDMRALDNTAQPSGAALVAGYQSEAASGQKDARWSGYVIESADQVRNRAEYTDYYANAFYTDQAAKNKTVTPYLPSDAGRVSVLADTNIVLNGFVKAVHVSAGSRGGELDLAASKLAVVANGAAAPTGYVALQSGKLNDLGMESIFIGGTRTAEINKTTKLATGATVLDVQATDVTVEKDAALSAPELILAAQNTLILKAGSRVAGNGSASDDAKSYVIGDAGTGVSGDGALVRVASTRQAALTRNNTSRSTGDLLIESGARVVADKSLTLDSTRSSKVESADSVKLAQGGALALGASRINIGQVPDGVDGLVVDAGQLAGAQDISLTSYSTLDLYGAAQLGSATLNSLNIRAAGIAGYGSGNTAQLQAKNVRLDNPSGTAFAAAAGQPAGDGSLTVKSDNIVLGEGAFKVRGYSAVNLQAAQDVKVLGDTSKSSSFDVARDGGTAALTISASRITAAKGSDYAINSTGKLTTALPSVIAANQVAADLGGKLALTAQSINHGGLIELPSGVVELHATGSAPGDGVTVTGSILANGVTKQFDSVTAYSPGGQVRLTGDHGNVALGAGAVIDVSATGAEAGRFDVSASQGSFTNSGTLKGSAGAGQRQGLFSADVATLPDFGGINQALNTGGFTESRDLRVRTGNVAIAGTDAVKAHNFTLAVDGGKLDVAGKIDASGSQGGAIKLYSRDDLSVQSGAVLSVAATGAGQSGGSMELGSSSGTLALKSGSALDLSGPAGGGKVLLRAARTTDNQDVKIAPIAATINNAAEIVAEAVKVYDKVGSTAISQLGTGTSSGAKLGLDSIAADNNDFMLNTAAVKTRLGESANTGFHLRSGVEVSTTGDLTVTNDLSLHTWRYDPVTGVRITDATTLASGKSANGNLESGILSLRAGGNLLFSGSLSDGFNNATNTANLNTGGASWAYRLVGGADAGAANPMAVKPDAIKGDVTIAASKLVRTGAANIDVAAGRDFKLLGVNDASAVLYTAGVQGETLSNYVVSPIKNAPVTATPVPNFPVNGGDIAIRAGRDVSGAITQQLFSQWLQRQGSTDADGNLITANGLTTPTSPAAYVPGWWINFANFHQGVGALAGGNISVSAAQDVKNLSAVIPTTGRLVDGNDSTRKAYAGSQASAGQLLVTGGGNLRVDAGRDVLSGVYLAANGDAVVRAGRDLAVGRKVKDTATKLTSTENAKAENPVYAIFGIAGGQASAIARNNLTVETAVNPTVVQQDNKILPSGTNKAAPQRTYLNTYQETDALKLQAIAGDAKLNLDSNGSLQLAFGGSQTAANNANTMLALQLTTGGPTPDSTANTTALTTLLTLPAVLQINALQGDVQVKGSASLFPSGKGNLNLLAGNNVQLADGQYLNLSDADPDKQANPVYAPITKNGSLISGPVYQQLTTLINGLTQPLHAGIPVHKGDASPANLVALNGDLAGTYYLAKPLRAFAGGDINGTQFNIQHNNPADVSSIIAGGNISYPATASSSTPAGQVPTGVINLDGPGQLYLQAGNSIDLGGSGGVLSRGNQVNTVLDRQGANITLMAGVTGQPSYADFIRQYFNAGEQKSIADSIRTLVGQTGLTDAQALAAFTALPAGQQASAPIARQVQDRLFLILGQAGYDKTQGKTKPYDKAYAALATLFPASAGQTGAHDDIGLLYSQIKALSGGDIYLFAPHGSVNAGQTTATGGGKAPSDLGIVVQGIGSIRGLVDQDFLVNTSRVFTLRGTPAGQPARIDPKTYALNDGDILLWSSNGDIDAGKGAKTAVSAPPPLLLTNRTTGETTLVYTSVSGSGIRAFLTNDTDTAGVVNLIAPKGTINAGDAGIGAININLAGNLVVGGGNIDLGGGFSGGVPIASVGGIAGSVGNVGNSSGDASKTTDSLNQAVASSAAAAQALKDAFKPAFVSVEVVGFGQ